MRNGIGKSLQFPVYVLQFLILLLQVFVQIIKCDFLLMLLHKEFDNPGVLGLEYARLKLRPEPDPIARQM